jgi:hypothetical protein
MVKKGAISSAAEENNQGLKQGIAPANQIRFRLCRNSPDEQTIQKPEDLHFFPLIL